MHLLGIYLAFAWHYEGLRAPFIVLLLGICFARLGTHINAAHFSPFAPLIYLRAYIRMKHRLNADKQRI